MRWPRGRLSVRRMMVMVWGLGIVIHPVVAAWRAFRHPIVHLHIGVYEDAGEVLDSMRMPAEPFWRGFGRQAFGLRSAGDESCRSGMPEHWEMCELNNADLRQLIKSNPDPARRARELSELHVKIWRANGRDAHLDEEDQVRIEIPTPRAAK